MTLWCVFEHCVLLLHDTPVILVPWPPRPLGFLTHVSTWLLGFATYSGVSGTLAALAGQFPFVFLNIGACDATILILYE